MLVLNKDDIQIYLSRIKEINFIDRAWRKLYNLKMKYIKRQILPQVIGNKIDAIRFILNRTIRFDKLKFLTYQFTNKENLREIQDIVTNSQNIRDKVLKKYKRQSDIVYPPIETEKYSYKPHKDYWLSINRIVPLKRIEIQLEAFKMTPEERLLIIGDFESREYYDYLQSIKPENVTFLGVVHETEKIEKLSECKGFIFTAQDEDFGMSVVEATASGKPVIAPREGGCIETIREGVTGELIENINAEKLSQCIQKIGPKVETYKEACLQHARKFDVFFFTEKMIQHIEKRDPFRKTLNIRITR
jgi:glycosyltransferase involved in cell wall biosynthesis